MTRPIGKFIAVLVLATLTTPSLIKPGVFGQTRDVALLTQPEGDVRVRRGRRGRAQRIREDVLLSVSDLVKVVGDGSTAVIYQAYVPITRLGSNDQFLVMRRMPFAREDVLTRERFNDFKLIYLTAHQNRNKPSPATMGGPEDA